MNKVLEWAKSHPWEAGGLAFVVGIGFLILFRGGSGSQSSGPDASLAAYLQAETAQSQYSDALSAVQSNNQAATQQAAIQAASQIDINNTWAASDLATTTSNNDTAIKSNLIDKIGAVANNLGTVLTSTTFANSGSASNSGGSSFLWGLFGSGPSSSSSGSASGSSSQSFVANSQQAAAEAELNQIANTQFHIGN
jgi:hypothetical protein